MRVFRLTMRWQNLFLYGAVLGLLLVLLQFSRYKLLLATHAEEWYVGLVALLFTGVGAWTAMQFVRPRNAPLPPTLPEPRPIPAKRLEMHHITPREYEVLLLMAEGLSNQEIADRLFVSLHTVKTHASNLLSKLGAQRRTQAIQVAKALGILEG